MSANVNRLQQVLADLVTVSAIEADTLVLHPDVIQLKEELAVPVRTAQEKVPEPEIEVDVDVAPGLRVLADRERLFQIVENLLLNAARHGAPPVRSRQSPLMTGSGSSCATRVPVCRRRSDRASSSGS